MPGAEEQKEWDCVVIGGGVVGVAVFRALCLRGARTLLCERMPRLAAGASRGNSGMLHTGFDATPGTVEAGMVRRGHQLFWEWVRRRSARGLATPCKRLGALMLAWDAAELARLRGVAAQAEQNGVGVSLLEPAELYGAEPNLAPGAVGALRIPGETAVDPFIVPQLYAEEARAAGGELRLRCDVVRCARDGRRWRVTTRRGGAAAAEEAVRARCVVNCAGLQGGRVEALRLGAAPAWEVRPRLGRYAVFDRAASSLVGHMLLPLPTQKSKGVILFPTVYGDVVIGPTAEDPGERPPHVEVMARLTDAARRRVPALAHHAVAWDYAGSRPALAGRKDYWLETAHDASWVTVAGIRSTGLSSALALGEDAARRLGWGGAEREAPEVGVAAARARADAMVHPISANGWPAPRL